jgi:hypothetical protein
LLRTSAERSRIMLSCALQKMWTRQTMPPVDEIKKSNFVLTLQILKGYVFEH